jgi:hypothetical protein
VSGLIGVRGIKDEIDISYDAVAPVDVTALVLLRARAIAGQPIEDSILLCARLPVTVEDRDRAARLGFDLAAPYCPFTAQLAGASALGHADLASRLRAAGALAFTEGVRVTGLAPPRFSWKAFIDDPRLLLAQDPPTARTQLAAAADQLRALIAIAARSGRRGRVRAEEFLPELLLAGAPEIAGRIAVHRNTLLYRVARIGKLTSLSLKDQRDRTLVLLAVTWEAIAGGVRPAAGEPGDPGF